MHTHADQSAEKLCFLSGELASISVVLECMAAHATESSIDPAVCVLAIEGLYGEGGVMM